MNSGKGPGRFTTAPESGNVIIGTIAFELLNVVIDKRFRQRGKAFGNVKDFHNQLSNRRQAGIEIEEKTKTAAMRCIPARLCGLAFQCQETTN